MTTALKLKDAPWKKSYMTNLDNILKSSDSICQQMSVIVKAMVFPVVMHGCGGASKEWWLHGCRRAERSYSTFKVRRGSGEEIPLVQGKEQCLHFAGAAVKRYPTPKVRATQVRWWVLQEGIRGQTY